jgi:hypothetical protein
VSRLAPLSLGASIPEWAPRVRRRCRGLRVAPEVIGRCGVPGPERVQRWWWGRRGPGPAGSGHPRPAVEARVPLSRRERCSSQMKREHTPSPCRRLVCVLFHVCLGGVAVLNDFRFPFPVSLPPSRMNASSEAELIALISTRAAALWSPRTQWSLCAFLTSCHVMSRHVMSRHVLHAHVVLCRSVHWSGPGSAPTNRGPQALSVLA